MRTLPIRRAIFLGLLLCAALVTGCASVQSSVTRFHALEKQKDGTYGTYAVYTPKEKESSLEYATYADLLKKQLNARGFREVALSQRPTYVAFFAYDVQRSGTSTTSFYRPQASGDSAFARGFNATAVGTATTEAAYTRSVMFRLVAPPDADASAPRKTIYEARLASTGSSGEINRVMPTLVKAMFKDFPGKSGETVRVDLPME